jgi:tRNA-splicing ligase RtcB
MSTPSMLRRVSETVWEIPPSYKPGMRVPARIFGSERLIREMDDGVFDQVTNVAMLPGILKYAFCMPDGHWGYGFPIGGVAVMNPDEGVISPGGIGFDVNCGMRLVATNFTYEEVKPRLRELVDRLFARVPSGVGCSGFINISRDEFCTAVGKSGLSVPAITILRFKSPNLKTFLTMLWPELTESPFPIRSS